MITMISAMTNGRVIGAKGGGIPWHLPRDVSHFRGYTADKFMLLGRRTFDEMTGWFTTQTPLVLTSQENYQPAIGSAVNSVPEAIEVASAAGASELVVSGGASVYAAALPHADKLVLTLIDAQIEGAAFFPDYESMGTWATVSETHFAADEENAYAMTFRTLQHVTEPTST